LQIAQFLFSICRSIHLADGATSMPVCGAILVAQIILKGIAWLKSRLAFRRVSPRPRVKGQKHLLNVISCEAAGTMR
jgi:hypothetical protein